MSTNPNDGGPATKGDLRVWWIPQVPGTAFRVAVPSAEEGARLLRALAAYDLFQLEHQIKPDFSNAGGLEEFDGGEWCDWMDPEGEFDDVLEWYDALLKAREGKS